MNQQGTWRVFVFLICIDEWKPKRSGLLIKSLSLSKVPETVEAASTPRELDSTVSHIEENEASIFCSLALYKN